MVLLYQVMTVTGLGAFLFAAPALAVISIIFAARQDNHFYQALNLFSILLYLLWIALGLFLNIRPQWLPEWMDFPVLGIWSAMAAVPHLLVWRSGKREKNRLRIKAGIFGIASVLTATTGILLTCYGATS